VGCHDVCLYVHVDQVVGMGERRRMAVVMENKNVTCWCSTWTDIPPRFWEEFQNL
jgi:hypothetical protein